MNVKVMTEIELVLLRGWMSEVYNSGRGFAPVSKEQLLKLGTKLTELDEELLERVLEDPKQLSFSDENFDETIKQIQSGEFDKKEEDDKQK